ncbi:hypothetical protein [Cysteiniphilum sp. JM-1]|uniref:hypothetical protein n=1 Tax=Cysteiniphilum sp. JM-1 TaxID=2610891 RepID=UPI001248218E|nr:hypothetical protein [Cysteiniphilum sp. JM-1]
MREENAEKLAHQITKKIRQISSDHLASILTACNQMILNNVYTGNSDNIMMHIIKHTCEFCLNENENNSSNNPSDIIYHYTDISLNYKIILNDIYDMMSRVIVDEAILKNIPSYQT